MTLGNDISPAGVASRPTDHSNARRAEIARLIALARDMIDDGSEQMVRDYLIHALGALDRVRDSVATDRH